MSANPMPSGRGRLPGMGSPAPAGETPAAASSAEEAPAADVQASPAKPAQPRTRSSSSRRRDRPPSTPIDGPYAGEAKMQVNPRIYTSIWSHYEELVDALPRAQRRGALTALVNAILAQHAPENAAEALAAITELRHAEARPRPES